MTLHFRSRLRVSDLSALLVAAATACSGGAVAYKRSP